MTGLFFAVAAALSNAASATGHAFLTTARFLITVAHGLTGGHAPVAFFVAFVLVPLAVFRTLYTLRREVRPSPRDAIPLALWGVAMSTIFLLSALSIGVNQ